MERETEYLNMTCMNMTVRKYFPLDFFAANHLATLNIKQEADIIRSVADILALNSFITLH